MLTDNTNLLLAMVVSQGAILWCDTSTGALRFWSHGLPKEEGIPAT